MSCRHRDEGFRAQMLAAGVADEGGVVAEIDDGGDQHGKRLGDTVAQRPGDEIVGLHGQMRTMLLRARADGDQDGRLLDPGGDFRPGEVFDPGTGRDGHR